MSIRSPYLQKSLKEELARLFAISFGVFLFILFFQPFPLGMLDFNNRLLYVAGFGIITFLLACLIFIIIPFTIPRWFNVSEWESGPPFILTTLLLIITATAFSFYIRYVGKVELTLYILFKIILVCLLPIIILVTQYKNKSLEKVIEVLKAQNKAYFQKIQEHSKAEGDHTVDLFSSNRADKLSLKQKDIIFIKSADNYAEVFYTKDAQIKKKMLRNTLKDIELQLTTAKNIIRCHRTCLINIQYVEQLKRQYGSYYIKANQIEEKIPVSRQYLMLVKESLQETD